MGVEPVERTFSFVDLAGFTALTEAHGDVDALSLLDRFIDLARRSLAQGDDLVKSIGDAVMIASSNPHAAVSTLAAIWERCGEISEFPLARAGAHHGPAVSRDGDYFGAAVNLAARVAGHAGGGQVLATAKVAVAAREHGLEVVEFGTHRLRNLTAPVELFEILLGDKSDTIDPVCRMRVDPLSASGSLCHAGERFWFCSLSCAATFAANPRHYLPPVAERET